MSHPPRGSNAWELSLTQNLPASVTGTSGGNTSQSFNIPLRVALHCLFATLQSLRCGYRNRGNRWVNRRPSLSTLRLHP
jgi:hypothetical protein